MTTKTSLILERLNKLNSLAKERVVELFWIPRFNRIRGNEIADFLARYGSGKQLMDPEPAVENILYTDSEILPTVGGEN